jgi:hypothetical protein
MDHYKTDRKFLGEQGLKSCEWTVESWANYKDEKVADIELCIGDGCSGIYFHTPDQVKALYNVLGDALEALNDLEEELEKEHGKTEQEQPEEQVSK